jgi:hypothetical protein
MKGILPTGALLLSSLLVSLLIVEILLRFTDQGFVDP